MKRSARKKWLIITSFFLISNSYSANYLDRLLYEAHLWQKPVGSDVINNTSEDIKKVSLFKKYPVLARKLPYVSLGDLPTPIKKCTKFGASIGVSNFYIKDDGKINSTFGGSSVRKLEFLLADARTNNAKTVIISSDLGSSSTLALALYAKQLNMSTIAILSGQKNTESARNVLLALASYDAEIHYHPSALLQDTAALNVFLEFERKKGFYPYIMPAGLSNELAAVGYVNAAFELKEQIALGVMPEPDYIFLPVGTMAAAAGLILGLAAAGLKSNVICARVDARAEELALYSLTQATQKFLGSLEAAFVTNIVQDTLKINGDFYRNTEAIVKQVAQDIARLQSTENIVLDGLEAGKAFSTCLSEINKNKLHKSVVLFWNTSSPFDYSRIQKTTTYKKLPESLYSFFA